MCLDARVGGDLTELIFLGLICLFGFVCLFC